MAPVIPFLLLESISHVLTQGCVHVFQYQHQEDDPLSSTTIQVAWHHVLC